MGRKMNEHKHKLTENESERERRCKLFFKRNECADCTATSHEMDYIFPVCIQAKQSKMKQRQAKQSKGKEKFLDRPTDQPSEQI